MSFAHVHNYWGIIKQGPISQEFENIFDYKNKRDIQIPKTWFRNYFRDLSVYGLELSAEGEKILWKFFLSVESEYEAKKRGNALLFTVRK